ncbi:dTDP-4-dehydrorhamnose 3,5-epimerase family protein [Micromonospora aurantiaca]|uniref:dTDP-4-dehydrorhamnose 3,5-epimerase family protein n=1 Tax=Micromonospora TaxID=1873 RepID=UPI00296F510B|nr:dTDP-4-dehydrorhamnose 3,5-epimerase family protein [Micromonospora sp. BRA006-A]MDW3848656.1 dTDP-4-dehydrorhamnose 3,5-epimerase family protein [Micromonospora sp. BRA006-A]
MQVRELSVSGAYEFVPDVFPDDRGLFVSPFQQQGFRSVTGHPALPVAQTNHSRSRRGVVRGVHFTTTPPGTAKYVYCPRGRSMDIVVDIRVGSPTYGQWDAVLLDQEDFRALYLPVGVGHAFVALEDETVMSYLLTNPYVPEYEQSIAALDPALGLPVPTDIEPVQSERDRAAMTLEQARRAGLLPDYETCRRAEKAVWEA